MLAQIFIDLQTRNKPLQYLYGAGRDMQAYRSCTMSTPAFYLRAHHYTQ